MIISNSYDLYVTSNHVLLMKIRVVVNIKIGHYLKNYWVTGYKSTHKFKCFAFFLDLVGQNAKIVKFATF